MRSISPHIQALLFQHDCVIVPGLGGFVTNPQGAKLNSARLKIHPPYKEIGFNSRLVKNDGLLAKEIENAFEISYNEAIQEIAQFVQSINQALNENNQFEFEGVGLLYKDMSRNLRFRQNGQTNFSLSSFGLGSIAALPLRNQQNEDAVVESNIQKETITPVISLGENVSEEKESVQIEEREKFNWKKVASIAAILILVLYSIWLPTQINIITDDDFQVSDFNPFKETICSQYDFRANLPETISLPEDESVLKLPTKELLTQQYFSASFFDKNSEHFDPKRFVTIKLRNNLAVISTTRVAGTYTGIYPGMRYYIIGGCFSIESNAVDYVKSLRKQGYNAAIVDIYKGLFRVAINAYETKKNAIEDLANIRSQVLPEAWVARIKS